MKYYFHHEQAYDMFQRIAPGKYTVEEKYNIEKRQFEFKLIFDTPKDETAFYLKCRFEPLVLTSL
jgi:hypothetical protein